jgi:hypothetical protein
LVVGDEGERMKKKTRGTREVLIGDGDDAASRNVIGGGEATTSPETGMTRMAAASLAEARKETLVLGCGWVRGARQQQSLRVWVRWWSGSLAEVGEGGV